MVQSVLKRPVLTVLLLVLSAGAASADTGGIDISSWVGTAQTNLFSMITQAGPLLFGMMAAIAGVTLVMTLIRNITKG